MGEIKRGDIFLVNLDPVVGSEQGKTRPVLVIQNDVGNAYSPVVIVAAITSQIYKTEYPTNVFLPKEKSNLPKDSTVMLNQIRTIDKQRLINHLGHIPPEYMKKVDEAIMVSLGLVQF